MLAEYKNKTNIGVAIGLILEIAGQVINRQMPDLILVGSIIILIGVVFFIWGCMNYCAGKGYPKVLGLLGLLSCIGLIVLVVLPDKNKSA
jgi:hypothetical protein